MAPCPLSPSLTSTRSKFFELEFLRSHLLSEVLSLLSDTEAEESFIVVTLFSSNRSALPSSWSPLLVDRDFLVPSLGFLELGSSRCIAWDFADLGALYNASHHDLASHTENKRLKAFHIRS